MSTNMRMKDPRKVARKVKAAALGAPLGVLGSYIPLRLAIPDLPDAVDAAIMSLVSALLAWALGWAARPAPEDKIVQDNT